MRSHGKFSQPLRFRRTIFEQLKILGAALVLSALILGAFEGSAVADDPPRTIYWISMRGITEDSLPSFVRVSRAVEDGRTQAIQACDGKTYYMTPGDHASYQVALSAGDTIQLHAGAQPASSLIECMVQADEG